MSGDTFFSLPYSKRINRIDFAVAGVPFDTLATARIGASLGPDAIRQVSGSLGYNRGLCLDVKNLVNGCDFGDFEINNGNTYKTFPLITQQLGELLKNSIIPIVIGGDHSIAFPELMAYKKQYGKTAIVHFDAHSDTGYNPYDASAPYNHGTPFLDAINNECILTDNSIQVGMRGYLVTEDNHKFAKDSGMTMVTGNEMHKIGIEKTAEIINKVTGSSPLFVTFDIDFLDPAYGPGTGTPENEGFSTWEAIRLVRSLAGKTIVGFDLVCCNPNYDKSQITAYAAAAIIYEFISLIAFKKGQEDKK